MQLWHRLRGGRGLAVLAGGCEGTLPGPATAGRDYGLPPWSLLRTPRTPTQRPLFSLVTLPTLLLPGHSTPATAVSLGVRLPHGEQGSVALPWSRAGVK
ncbi:rCG62930 [Rattus norvegicus]|uniref:RCG62930 n=1 Tax=Rattus norvegicus TaxID=10116 RepID=A6I456_RAT|nr:rCG62930 [Rattus norvegicus]